MNTDYSLRAQAASLILELSCKLGRLEGRVRRKVDMTLKMVSLVPGDESSILVPVAGHTQR